MKKALLLGRMPPDPAPMSPHQDSQIVVELQRFHGGSPTNSSSQSLGAISAPGNMALPPLVSRVKETYATPCQGITSMGLITFITIPEAAGEPQIPFIIAAASCTREDMFDVQRLINMLLMRTTIAAALLCGSKQAGS